MRKILFFSVLFLVLGFADMNAQKTPGQYGVQVGVFIEKVPSDYFKGLSDVYMQIDQNQIYRYYTGNYTEKSAADAARQTALDAGYSYARVIDFDEIRRLCAASCGLPVATPVNEPSYLESIFFDFDKSFLRAKSKSELDKLYQILIDNPTYSAELRAHTDAKGSNEYNDALSQRRADSAKNYLLGKGIDASRLAATTYGETDPIAKNELAGGVDTPEGRQLNRRVELVVKGPDGQVIQIVRDINVPGGLRYIGG
ncbi:MAG: OmpA family protein [Bacteroidota bacterium]